MRLIKRKPSLERTCLTYLFYVFILHFTEHDMQQLNGYTSKLFYYFYNISFIITSGFKWDLVACHKPSIWLANTTIYSKCSRKHGLVPLDWFTIEVLVRTIYRLQGWYNIVIQVDKTNDSFCKAISFLMCICKPLYHGS